MTLYSPSESAFMGVTDGRHKPAGGLIELGGVGSIMFPGLLGVARNPVGSQTRPPGDVRSLPKQGKVVKACSEFLPSVLRPSKPKSR
jgi:hypothetical protein